MTLDDIRQQIRAHVVLSVQTDLSDAQITEFVTTTIERLQQASDWRYQENSVQIPIAANSYLGTALPSDFVVEAAVYQYNPPTTAGPGWIMPIGRLPGGRIDWATQSTMQDRNEAYPVPAPSGLSYYLWMDQIWIVPTQSSAITIQLDYYSDPANNSQPTDSIGLIGVSPRAVLWGALQLTYLYLHEVELAGAVGSIYDQLTDAAFKREQGARVGAKAYSRGR